MTIDKAIEIKTLYIEHLPPGVNEDWINADKLSLEALKAIKTARYFLLPNCLKQLPGETEE